METDEKVFQQKKYESFCTSLNRIKEDEQRWVSILLLIYAGVFAYILTEEYEKRQVDNWIVVTVIILTTSYWIYHATTLRIQYYRTMIRIIEIEEKFLSVPDQRKINTYADTKPYESKLSEVALACGLMFIAILFILLKIESDNRLLVLVPFVISIGIFWFWHLIDKTRVEALIRDQKNDLNPQ